MSNRTHFVFIVPGKPTGKARPRVTRKGVYTPRKSKVYEHLVALHFRKYNPEYQLLEDAEYHVDIHIYLQVPPSWSKRNKELACAGLLSPRTKPDLDNVAKAVLDALNGLAFKDDACVTRLIVEKHYGRANEVKVVGRGWVAGAAKLPLPGGPVPLLELERQQPSNTPTEYIPTSSICNHE